MHRRAAKGHDIDGNMRRRAESVYHKCWSW